MVPYQRPYPGAANPDILTPYTALPARGIEHPDEPRAGGRAYEVANPGFAAPHAGSSVRGMGVDIISRDSRSPAALASRGMDVVAVFGASAPLPGDPVYEEGVRCGRLLAEAGYAVATGGYAGLMEAASLGAREAGGRVIGVTVPDVFPDRQGGNAHLTEETRTASLLERIHEMVALSVASIALPGSLGTATELLVAWNLAYVARFTSAVPKPVVAVGERWRRLVPLLTDELQTDGSLVTLVDTVDEAVKAVTAAAHGR